MGEPHNDTIPIIETSIKKSSRDIAQVDIIDHYLQALTLLEHFTILGGGELGGWENGRGALHTVNSRRATS